MSQNANCQTGDALESAPKSAPENAPTGAIADACANAVAVAIARADARPASLNIGAHLGLALAAVIALAAVVVVIGISRLSALKESIRLIGEDRMPKVVKLGAITDDVNLIAHELCNALIWDDAAKVATALDTVQQTRDKITRTLDARAPTITSDEGIKRLAVMTATRAAFVPLQMEFIDLMRDGKKGEAKVLLTSKLRPTQLAYMEALDKLKNLQLELIAQAAVDGEALYVHARNLMFGLLAGMLLLGTLVAGCSRAASLAPSAKPWRWPKRWPPATWAHTST